MATVLEGFLVRLGFEIDQDQLGKFNNAVQMAGKSFLAVGKAAIGAGVAIGAAFAKSTAEINDLYKISNNSGASIKGILSLQGAVERVGGSAENVNAALADFSLKSKTYGAAFEDMVRGQLGVSLRDTNGQARDMGDVFVDMSAKLAKLAKTDPGLARMKAEALGLGAIFDDIVKGDFPAELARSQHFAGLFGKEIDAGANASHRLMNELGQVWDTVGQAAMSASAQITDALQLDKKLADFNNGFADFLKSTIDSQIQIIKDASGFFDWVGKVLFGSGDYYDDSRRKVLEERIKSGKATEEEKQELENLNVKKADNDAADSAHIDRDYAQATGLGAKWDDDTALKAEFFGVDTNDKREMSALANREVTDEDLAGLAESDPEAFKLGLELQKRQRAKAQAEVGESFKQATSTPVKKDIGYDQNAKSYDIDGPFAGSPAAKEAANISAARGVVTNNADNRTTQSTTNITQTININGAGDPQAVGRAVAEQTAALGHNQNNQRIS